MRSRNIWPAPVMLAFLFLPFYLTAQSVAINTDGSTAAASALLDVKSTSKGILVPRMTSAQRTAISSPAVGLLVFDSTTESFWFYTSAGWTELAEGNSPWAVNGSNISNTNSGSVIIGSGISGGKLNVSAGNSVIANFNGGTNTSFLGLYESGQYRGYLGSYSGAAEDVDFGTGALNSTGKVHLTLQAVPAFTLDNDGDVGIGTTSPSEKLVISSGNILLSNSNLGIRLNNADRPLITRGFDAFTSGNYTGIGRWGLFMEPSRLTLGIPNISGKAFEWAKYEPNSSRTALLTLDLNGEMKRPSQGSPDLLPYCVGSVAFDGTILGGSGNFSVVVQNLGTPTSPILVKDITLTGVTYSPEQFAVLVTPYLDNTSNDVYPLVTNSSGKIRVRMYDDNGDTWPQAFSFIVYKLN